MHSSATATPEAPRLGDARVPRLVILAAVAWQVVAIGVLFVTGLTRSGDLPSVLGYVLYEGAVAAGISTLIFGATRRRPITAAGGGISALFFAVWLFVYMACPSS